MCVRVCLSIREPRLKAFQLRNAPRAWRLAHLHLCCHGNCQVDFLVFFGGSLRLSLSLFICFFSPVTFCVNPSYHLFSLHFSNKFGGFILRRTKNNTDREERERFVLGQSELQICIVCVLKSMAVITLLLVLLF